MSDSVDATVTVWQYPFPFLYYLVRFRVCRIRAVQLDNKSVLENMVELIQPITIIQNVSLRTAGRTYTGPRH